MLTLLELFTSTHIKWWKQVNEGWRDGKTILSFVEIDSMVTYYVNIEIVHTYRPNSTEHFLLTSRSEIGKVDSL